LPFLLLAQFQQNKLLNSILQIDYCDDISEKGANQVQISVVGVKNKKKLKINLSHLDYEDLFFFQQISRSKVEQELRDEIIVLKSDNVDYKEKVKQLSSERDTLSVKVHAIEYKLQVLEDMDTGLIDLSRDFDARLNSMIKEFQGHLNEVIVQLKEALAEKAAADDIICGLQEKMTKTLEDKKSPSKHHDAELVKLRKQFRSLTDENELLVKCNQFLLKLLAETKDLHRAQPRTLLHAKNKTEVLNTLAQIVDVSDDSNNS